MEPGGRGELDELSPSQPSPVGRALKKQSNNELHKQKVSPTGGDLEGA